MPSSGSLMRTTLLEPQRGLWGFHCERQTALFPVMLLVTLVSCTQLDGLAPAARAPRASVSGIQTGAFQRRGRNCFLRHCCVFQIFFLIAGLARWPWEHKLTSGVWKDCLEEPFSDSCCSLTDRQTGETWRTGKPLCVSNLWPEEYRQQKICSNVKRCGLLFFFIYIFYFSWTLPRCGWSMGPL